jgi:hypothetical protein
MWLIVRRTMIGAGVILLACANTAPASATSAGAPKTSTRDLKAGHGGKAAQPKGVGVSPKAEPGGALASALQNALRNKG